MYICICILSLTDIIATNNLITIHNTAVIPCGIADHDMIGCIQKVHNFKFPARKVNCRKAAVKKILVCRQPTGSYLTYRVKLCFFATKFFFNYKNRGRKIEPVVLEWRCMSLGKMDFKIFKKKM